jgi:hypothetical protein
MTLRYRWLRRRRSPPRSTNGIPLRVGSRRGCRRWEGHLLGCPLQVPGSHSHSSRRISAATLINIIIVTVRLSTLQIISILAGLWRPSTATLSRAQCITIVFPTPLLSGIDAGPAPHSSPPSQPYSGSIVDSCISASSSIPLHAMSCHTSIAAWTCPIPDSSPCFFFFTSGRCILSCYWLYVSFFRTESRLHTELICHMGVLYC